MADEDYEPKTKVKYHGICWFCRERFKSKNESTKLDDSSRASFVQDVCSASNEVGLRTESKRSDILSGKQEVLYHRSCRNPYYAQDETEILRRQSNRKEKFEWKLLCMICGKSCDRRRKRDPKRGWSLCDGHGLTKDETTCMYDRIMKAARIKNDQEVIARLNECPNSIKPGNLVSVKLLTCHR